MSLNYEPATPGFHPVAGADAYLGGAAGGGRSAEPQRVVPCTLFIPVAWECIIHVWRVQHMPHRGLLRKNMAKLKRIFLTVSVGTPLCPCGIASPHLQGQPPVSPRLTRDFLKTPVDFGERCTLIEHAAQAKTPSSGLLAWKREFKLPWRKAGLLK